MKLSRYTTGFTGMPIRISYTFSSTNSKTGDVIQQWITPKAWEGDRSKQIDVKKSEEVCSDCPLLSSCYVKKGTASMGLKSTSKSTNHTVGCEKKNLDLFKDKFVRFGAFGEPVLSGKDVVKSITEVAKSWTGYTHRWRDLKFHWSNRYFMASVEDVKGKREANALGYRTFRVGSSVEDKLPDEVLCPASKEAGRKVTCAKCKLCKGNTSKAKNIFIVKH